MTGGLLLHPALAGQELATGANAIYQSAMAGAIRRIEKTRVSSRVCDQRAGIWIPVTSFPPPVAD